jgi:peptide/nickel transport system substrate-binding protein
MYDTLVGYDERGALVPRIATAWTYNDSATAIDVDLRNDVVFHSGRKLTATDVVYTLDRAKRLGIGVASFIPDYESATALDDTHLTIVLKAPNTNFVGALSKVYLVDSVLVQSNTGTDDGQSWLANNDAGSGVYTLTGYTANQQAAFSRFDNSWRFEADRPVALVYRYITESATLRDELVSGGVDVVTGLNPTDLGVVSARDDVDVVALPSPVQLYVMMNTQSGPTADIRVRQAIQDAYDYDGHISSILSGNGTVASGITSPTVSCRLDTGRGVRNLDEAKKLVEEAGAAGTTLRLAYQPVIPEHQKAATLLQSNLQEIGINLELDTVTFPEYTSMIGSAASTPDLAILWDFPFYPEIGPMLSRTYDSSFVDQTNYARYSNPAVDSLLREATAETDRAAACADVQRAQEIIAADRVSVNISNPTLSTVVRDGVGGITFDPTAALFNPSLLTVAKP